MGRADGMSAPWPLADARPDRRTAPRGFEASPAALTPLRRRIQDAHRCDERAHVLALAQEAELSAREAGEAGALARTLAEAVRRARQGAGGVDALMHEFSLSSSEGIALMCLAEALLRVPDDATRDRLIRDKIGRGDWAAHLGHSPSLFVNAAAWGLLVTGKLVPTHSEGALGLSLHGLLARGGAPVIRRATDLAIRMLGRQFVTGETIADALANARERERRGYRFSYDMLGEAAVTAADADRYFRAYAEATMAIGAAAKGQGVVRGPGISIKLSALHPRYTRQQRERVMAELLPRVKSLALLARAHAVGFNIDAEETERLDLSLDILEALALDPALAGWDGIGFVVQAYGKRARPVIDWLIDLGRRSGHRLMVRLVKGAYWDTEIKAAQLGGYDDYPVFTRKLHTDVSYLACARAMLAAPDAIYPQFATHNAFSIGAIRAIAGASEFEFQCLHGMGETIYDAIVGTDPGRLPVRVYAPVGSHETLLAYLVRRLLENGANSSFVNQVVDTAIPIERLIEDPAEAVRRRGGHPNPDLPRPRDLFPGRANAAGLDLAAEPALGALGTALAANDDHEAGPILAASVTSSARPGAAVTNPADVDDVVGHVADATLADVRAAVETAEAALRSWAATPVAERTALLERWADALEADRSALIGLAIREAGKTARNAVSELREAVDFCRYYAAEARAGLEGARPVGPIVCISPWNFPLAIFTGQVAAALAAGNPVLAKPAEQTPLMAARAVSLAHGAGIPAGALQLLPGPGETVGAALVADPRIGGVVFTGSTAVAKMIERTLAARDDDPVLIAETGGLNAMIVDSSALPEQVVADAIESAFDSAGQRCSALRILCVQQEVADRVVPMLEGAMRELRVGSPLDFATDVGPVIDRDALGELERHVDAMRAESGCRVVQTKLAPEAARGAFLPPTLVEIPSLDTIRKEVFGPVLHVLRYRAADLPRLVQDLNAAGYGLTHGVHSRIDETIEEVAGAVRAGNVYVNRNIVGAVVGSQPFGGEGLSGTGPKAGGPFYLHRLARGTNPAWPSPAPGKAAALGALRRLAERDAPEPERGALLAALDAAAAHPYGSRPVDLPGPTGERNTLALHPRGVIGCLATGFAALAAQAAAIVATGNVALLPAGDAGQRVATALPAGAARIVPDVAAEPASAVLADLPAADLASLRVRIAERDGALTPVIMTEAPFRYPLWRLLAERTLSVNTAAAGGNAALLALEDRDAAA
jgi:RHH-type proline utilization regulon transcriptional repressor/proline dehydrogenase/delta 1-pyrroline-5-carboxylate dehydrogenase